jgi:hypothetical protein
MRSSIIIMYPLKTLESIPPLLHRSYSSTVPSPKWLPFCTAGRAVWYIQNVGQMTCNEFAPVLLSPLFMGMWMSWMAPVRPLNQCDSVPVSCLDCQSPSEQPCAANSAKFYSDHFSCIRNLRRPIKLQWEGLGPAYKHLPWIGSFLGFQGSGT